MKVDSSNARNVMLRMGKQIEAATRRGAIAAAHRCRQLMIERTRTSAPRTRVLTGTGGAVDTGGFLRSWKVALGHSLYYARLYNDAPHAGVIEYGRRPGKAPPPGVLDAWVRRKLVGTRGRGTKTIQKVESIAFLVGRAIKRRGIPGRYIMTDAQDQMRQITRESISLEVARALSQAGGKLA